MNVAQRLRTPDIHLLDHIIGAVYDIYNNNKISVKIESLFLLKFYYSYFTTMSRQALGPIQPPIQWAPEALPHGVKQLDVKLTTHLHLNV
jgi:hypothetical protein